MGRGGGGGGGGSDDCDTCKISVGDEESLYPKTATAPGNHLDGVHGRRTVTYMNIITSSLLAPSSRNH